ncbi:TolC family protein [Hyalangium sp.]|uniref:TolC family protein n=1 Tax=Hyalangium sp. TaxID=2028555 RepID=UPI002D685D5E|nr:TolC family protein [Hyalangium sp.]HYI01191.1 TolC family protein [Hyalangium sp.]
MLLAGSAAAEDPLTEEQYIQRVLTASLEARVAEAEAALGRAEAVGAGQWPNPGLEWQRQRAGSGRRTGESQDMVLASIPLVLSGRLGLEAEAAERGAQAAEARLSRARAELHREATRAFAEVLAAQQRRIILEESVAELKRLGEAIAVRERAGEAAGYERLRIEVEVAAVEDGLRGALLEQRQADTDALRLLGPEVKTLPPLQGSLAPVRGGPDGASLLAELEARRADVRALTLEAQGAESARRAAARSWIPEPTVSAGAQFLDVGQEGAGAGYVVGLSLPLPFFQRRQGEAARAEARRGLAEARRASLLHAARAQLTSALDAVKGWRERLVRHREDVLARAEELRRIAGTAYRGGSADLLVLVDAERASREARLTAVTLAVAVVEAEADLLLLAGAYDGAAPRSSTR